MKFVLSPLWVFGFALVLCGPVVAQMPKNPIADALSKCETWLKTGVNYGSNELWHLAYQSDATSIYLYAEKRLMLSLETATQTAANEGSVIVQRCMIQPIVHLDNLDELHLKNIGIDMSFWKDAAYYPDIVAAEQFAQLANNYTKSSNYVPFEGKGLGWQFLKCDARATQAVFYRPGSSTRPYIYSPFIEVFRETPSSPEISNLLARCPSG